MWGVGPQRGGGLDLGDSDGFKMHPAEPAGRADGVDLGRETQGRVRATLRLLPRAKEEEIRHLLKRNSKLVHLGAASSGEEARGSSG